jgi:hypothetical protein
MQSKATTVEQYLSELPDDRLEAIETVRKVILENLDQGFEEGIQYGMIGYYVPHSIFPAGYHCDPRQPLSFAGLGSQKNHMAIYLMCVYMNTPLREWFEKAWFAAGKKLDMGKARVRFKKIDDLALEVLGEAIRRVTAQKYIQVYESLLSSRNSSSRPSSPVPKKTATRKKVTTVKAATARKAAPTKKKVAVRKRTK